MKIFCFFEKSRKKGFLKDFCFNALVHPLYKIFLIYLYFGTRIQKIFCNFLLLLNFRFFQNFQNKSNFKKCLFAGKWWLTYYLWVYFQGKNLFRWKFSISTNFRLSRLIWSKNAKTLSILKSKKNKKRGKKLIGNLSKT